MTPFSEYIVFADESGDHGMETIDPQFPVFALVFCVFEKSAYLSQVEPAVRRFKYEFFGHDAVVLHEREIRKEMPPFDFLMADRSLRDRFLAAIEALIRDIDMTCYVQVINKVEHRAKYSTPWNPYEIAMHFGLEKICSHMRAKGQQGHKVHVIFESRGRNEDRDLELEFRRVVTNQSHFGWRRLDFTICEFEPVLSQRQQT